MNEAKLDAFCNLYRAMLREEVQAHPEQYGYGVDMVDAVVGRMREAFKRGSFNKDGNAIKRTCKVLCIAHTYKAMNAYWEKV